MSIISLIEASCADQEVDAVVNAANRQLWAGGGICGELFRRAGINELMEACNHYSIPLSDGQAVITPSFHMSNTKSIIHAVGPDFRKTPGALGELFLAYYNSLMVLMENGQHSIAFPLISSGIFAGDLEKPAEISARQCKMAYKKFTEDYPDYDVDVKVCVYEKRDMEGAIIGFGR